MRAGGLPFDELRELGRSYRVHVARLAKLRDRADDPEAIRYLNALCVRAYTALYARPVAERPTRSAWPEALADALARTWRAQSVAWMLLFVGLLVGGVLAHRNPESLHALVSGQLGYSPGQIDRLIASPAERARFFAGHDVAFGHHLFFGSHLFVHNTRVGLLSFAAGMLAGVPTVLLQLYNGILVGAFASIFVRDAWPFAFFAWILPHGIPELTAITLCASGGLLFGEAVAAPGRRRRRDALRDAVNPALLLFLAALPLFVVAAAIESFVRESNLSTVARLAVAAAMAGGIFTASLGARRLARRREVDHAWLRGLIAPLHRGSPDSGSARQR